MKIVLISDTHGLHKRMEHMLPPSGDILIHCGDCTNVGKQHEVHDFVHWFQNIKGYDYKIFIAGNHDWAFYRKPSWLKEIINDENLSQSDVTYLEDDFITIKFPEFSRPIKIYGSPWCPVFLNWAFNVPRNLLFKYWEQIPLDTDILITHCTPQEIRDYTNYGKEHVGCSSLRYYVETKVKPALHCFGDIHEGRGAMVVSNILFVNSSTATEQYEMINKPIIIDIQEINGKFIANVESI